MAQVFEHRRVPQLRRCSRWTSTRRRARAPALRGDQALRRQGIRRDLPVLEPLGPGRGRRANSPRSQPTSRATWPPSTAEFITGVRDPEQRRRLEWLPRRPARPGRRPLPRNLAGRIRRQLTVTLIGGRGVRFAPRFRVPPSARSGGECRPRETRHVTGLAVGPQPASRATRSRRTSWRFRLDHPRPAAGACGRGADTDPWQACCCTFRGAS